MVKRLWSLVLAIVLMLSLLPIMPIETDAVSDFQPLWPVDGSLAFINSLDVYPRSGSFHNGIDITAYGDNLNPPIYAIADGVIYENRDTCTHVSAGEGHSCKGSDTWGNYIMIQHEFNGETFFSTYAHLEHGSFLIIREENGKKKTIAVKNGEKVYAGDQIACMGSSGSSTGHHLHLEIWKGRRNSRNEDNQKLISKSFDYYLDNPNLPDQLCINKQLASKSKLYADWIKDHCELDGSYYIYSGFTYRDRKVCDLTFEMTTTESGWSLPGSNTTYANSVKKVSIPKGTQLCATAIYENDAKSAGHYWYETEYEGQKVYVYVPYTKHIKNNWGVSVTEVKKPEKLDLGDGYGLRGIVNTDGSVIQSIRGYVYAGNTTSGTPVTQSDLVKPNSTTYNIKNEINNTLLFDKIDKAGYYTYVVKAVMTTWYFGSSSTPQQATSKEIVLTDTQSYFTVGNPSTGNDHVEDSLLCYGQLTVTADETWVKSLPCSKGTDAASADVEGKAAVTGDTYTAIGLVLNDQGNYWYKVQTASGAIGYVYSGDVKFEQKSDLQVSGITSPTEHIQGDPFSVDGTIKTTYQTITFIYLNVERRVDGSTAVYTDIDAEGTEFDLSDYVVNFEELPVGDYTYTVSVRIETNYAVNAKEAGTKYTTVDVHSSRFSVISDECVHSYTSAVTKPGCKSQGYTTYTCTKCGYSYVGDYTNALGHDHQRTEYRKENCTTDGYAVYTCSRCGDAERYIYPATGHNYFEEYVEATCQERAKYVYTCGNCGDSYQQHVSPPSGEWSTTKPEGVDASLIESKTEYRYQTKEFTTSSSSALSGWVQYDSTSSWGEYGAWSDWSDTAISSGDAVQVETRVVYGYYYYLCPSCGAHMHGYGTNACYKWAGGCGGTIPNKFYKVWSTVSWDAANLKDWHGTGKYYTYIDGELVFKWSSGTAKTQYRSRTRAMETVYYFYRWSEWSAWSENVAVANDTTNVETRTLYRSLSDGLGEHDYMGDVTPPTCTSQGYTTYTCIVCGDSYVADYTQSGFHDYENGHCIYCGDADINGSIKGDLDLDGDVDAQDLTMLARHVAGIEVLTDVAALANADVDGSGGIDANDLTMHARYVAGIITSWDATG